MKIKNFYLVAALLAVVSFSACTPKLEQGKLLTAPELVTLVADDANDGQRFSVDGFLCTPVEMPGETDVPVTMMVMTDPGGEGEVICELVMIKGVKNNNFYVTDEHYADEDIRFVDNEGNTHNYDQYARYSFTAKKDKKTNLWNFTDVRIDKLDNSTYVPTVTHDDENYGEGETDANDAGNGEATEGAAE